MTRPKKQRMRRRRKKRIATKTTVRTANLRTVGHMTVTEETNATTGRTLSRRQLKALS